MKIRKAVLKDAQSIAKISVETWNTAYKDILPQSVLDARKVDDKRIASWSNKINKQSDITIVCEENNDVVGFLWAGINRDSKITISNELYAIYVDNAKQGKGIGKMLFNEYRKIIKNKPFYLFMAKGNVPTSKFYMAMGGKLNADYDKKANVENTIIEEIAYVFGEINND